MSRLRSQRILDDRSSLAGGLGLHSWAPPDDHIQKIPARAHIQSSLGGRTRTVPDDHHNHLGSLRRTCVPVHSRQHHVTCRNLQSGAWEKESCSSCACAPAREIASGACARQNLNDACQHRHPNLHPRYRISSCFASSLPSRASCAPSFDASRTSPRRQNHRPSRLSWICWTYRVACSCVRDRRSQ